MSLKQEEMKAFIVARASENLVYFMSSSLSGSLGSGLKGAGFSSIVSPRAEIMAEAKKVYTGTILSDYPAAHVYEESKTAIRKCENMHIRLDEIVKKMNEGNAPLNEMLSLYEEAQKLIKEETDTLNEAKAKINEYSK